MTYTDPTNFVDGTDGVAYDTNVKEANLQHVIVTDSTGALRDYIIVEGNGSGGTEIYSIAADGTMTLETTVPTTHVEAGDFDDFTVVVDDDGNTHLIDTGRDGMGSLKWDSTTDSWSYNFQPNDDFFTAGQVKLDVFKAEDGTIYGYAGSTSATGGAGTNIIEQYVYDPVTQTFDTANPITYSPTADLGKQFNSTWAEGFETGEMEVLLTNDGPKLLQWNDGGIARVEGFTLYDIDPVTGELVAGSASSYNFGTTADVTNFGQELEFVNEQASDELLFNQQTSTIEVDGNGNIVMTTGTWGTSEGDSYGLIVIDPRLSVPDSEDVNQDGDGDVDNSASVIAAYTEFGSQTVDGETIPATAWGSNAEISYSPDGAYMYITSSNTSGSLDPEDTYTVVVDTSDYSIVDWGVDTTAGYYSTDPTNDGATTDNTGAMSQILVTLSTGEQYYLSQYSDTANATSGWLAVSDVTADISTAPICFVSGTRITTESGYTNVEELKVGDKVLTQNNGYQAIRWIGSTKRKAVGNLAPILIRKGALGNTRDLRVSPQHRMLISGWQAELLFGEREVLVAATHLVNDHSVIRVEGGEVEYFHILFDNHEIIFAEDAPSESFLPGAEGQKSLSSAQAKEIFELFPELEGKFENYGESCRPSLRAFEGRMLAENVVQ